MEKMRQQGYCVEAIDQAQALSGEGMSFFRVTWMSHHIKECVDCEHANYFLGMEFEVAKLLDAVDKFVRGESLEADQGYKAAFDHVMMREMLAGRLQFHLIWADEMTRRRGLR